jgi:hypothetical protein
MRNLEKTVSCTNPCFTSDLGLLFGACDDIRGPRLGRRAHGEGRDRPRRRRGRKPGWGARFGATLSQDGATLSQDESRLAGVATGRCALLRRDRREGRQAGRAGGEGTRAHGRVSERTQPAPKRGRAGRSGAGASANASANAGHTMLDACGPHNSGRMQTCEQTGGRDGAGHGRKGTTRHTDTVKAWTRLQRVMPSASLVII